MHGVPEPMDEKDILIAQLRKENAALRQMIEDLQKQVKNLTEAVLLLRKNRFGSKSERTRNLLEEDGQLNLFNEIELEGDPKKKDKDPIQLFRNKVKVRQPKTKREVVTHGLPVLAPGIINHKGGGQKPGLLNGSKGANHVFRRTAKQSTQTI